MVVMTKGGERLRVVCISGKAQHGKDTTASLIKESLEVCGERVLVAHYADLLKYICSTYFKWDGKKDENGRHILQYVGTDVIRQKSPDYWVNFLADFLELFNGEWDWVLIPDTRFPNEVDLMKRRFNTIHVRVVRPNFVSPLTVEQQNHPSEVALDAYTPDYCLDNNGSLDALKATVNTWIKEKIYGH